MDKGYTPRKEGKTMVKKIAVIAAVAAAVAAVAAAILAVCYRAGRTREDYSFDFPADGE